MRLCQQLTSTENVQEACSPRLRFLSPECYESSESGVDHIVSVSYSLREIVSITAEEEKAFFAHFNASETLDALAPGGICSSIQFTSITVGECDLTLNVTLNPNGDELESVCIMASLDQPMLNSLGELHQEFVFAFTWQLTEWVVGQAR